VERKTSIVFLGNNEYSIEGLTIGTRDVGRRNTLCVHYRESSALKLLSLSVSALLGILQVNSELR
jgi:hypothetical protein